LLAVPRSVPVWEIPEPAVRPEVLAAGLQVDVALARTVATRAEHGQLEYDVRFLGDAVRAFGLAEAEDDEAALEPAHRRTLDAARAAIERDPDAVRGLRAYQTQAFLAEVRALQASGRPSVELAELAGPFARTLIAYRWYDRDTRRLLVDEAALRALYKKRWNEITGLTGPALALSLDEQRALLRFLIAHPALAFAPLAPDAGPDAARSRAFTGEVAANERRLEKIRDLARIDPSFPGALAEGVVLFRLGRFEAAAIAFERHLTAFPDGPWTLRARNYLKAALEAR
jgi:tetratricopeptide (TPR) repeat protein